MPLRSRLVDLQQMPVVHCSILAQTLSSQSIAALNMEHPETSGVESRDNDCEKIPKTRVIND
jgi:hypothetical protein